MTTTESARNVVGTHHLMDVTARPDVVFVEGHGAWLVDQRGRRYLDFVQGWAVNCLGHCPPAVVNALTVQAGRLINGSPAYYNFPSLRLAELLATHSDFDRVFFCNSGAEANEGAIKLARKWGRRFKEGAYEIVTFENGFYGRTLATMSASGKPGWDTMFAPQVPGFPKAILNDVASVDRLINDRTAAVMLEPVQGEGGVIPADIEFQRALRRLTRERHCLFIVDEVQTGIGRTGRLFAYQHWARDRAEAPDVMTLGKGLGAGVPLAALCAKTEAAVFEHGEQGGTFGGNPLMTAVGCAVLDELLRPGFLDDVAAKGDYLGTHLDELGEDLGLGRQRGLGLLRALDLGEDIAGDVVTAARECVEPGILLNAPRPNALRFMPALTITYAEIDMMLAGLRAAVQSVKDRIRSTRRA